VPRLPVSRLPAAPSSANQQERYQRILDAAIELGTSTDFEHVQMQDVAAAADVAIATLYRYFPSKAHLFVGVMSAQMDLVDLAAFTADPDKSRVDAVYELLHVMTRSMTRHRELSLSMIQSIILAYGQKTADPDRIEGRFLGLVMGVAGWGDDADEDQRRRGWLVIQCWFGVLMTVLNGDRPIETAEADIRRACELLLAP
jgi:AcrR family transcriptional regulator